MTDVLKFGKRIFTVGVVVTTIVWSIGVAALLPSVANAGVCPTLATGDMIKVTGNPAIYSVNKDLKVLYFPSGNEFKSWNADEKYGRYISVTQECFNSLSVPSAYPGGVNYRPGSYVVKRPASDQLYVVEANNTLAKISDADAKALYGVSYSVRTVADAFWPHYINRGVDISGLAHEGMLVKKDSKNWYVDAGNVLREVTETGMTANRFKTAFVHTVADSYLAGFTTGATIDALVSAIGNRTQDGTITPPTGSALTVAFASDNPAAKNIASGSAYNDVLKLSLSAGSGTVKVKGITLTKTGLIANTSITGVSVWDKDGNRHGDVMTSLTSDNKVTIGFATNPILVAAGTPETLLVKVNISGSISSGLVGFKVALATDVNSDATTGGTFPLEGNQMAIVSGSASLASTTIAALAVGGTANSTDSANVEIGASGVQKEIGKFRFTENSGNEDAIISSITFYLQGSVQDKDLKNFKVYASDNSVLGTAETLIDRYVTVKFSSPYTVPKSTNRTLSLKADIVDGSTHYFRVHIQNDYDLLIKGATTGFYVLPSNFSDSYDSSTGYFIVKSGTVTVNKNILSPSGNISSGASAVVLGKFDVKAVGENLEIRKIGLGVSEVHTGGVQKLLTGNVSVQDVTDSSTVVTLLTVAGSDTNLYSGHQYNLSSYLNVTSGETRKLQIVGNIDSTATSAQKYTAGIGNFYAKRLSTLDFADNLPTSGNTSTEANQLTVNTTALTCSKDTSMGNVTRAVGSTVVIGQFICTAGSAEGIRLSGVTFGFSGTGNVATNYQNLALWDGSTQLGSTITSVASSSNGFSFDLTIPKGGNKVLQVKAYITTAASGAATTTISSYNYTGVDSGNAVTGDAVNGQIVTVGSAALTISAYSDGTTLSKIYGASQTGIQLGKWKFAATGDSLNLKKVTFKAQYANGNDATALGTFGNLDLYNKAGVKVNDSSASYVTGDVVFQNLNVPVGNNEYEVLTLKGATNASGVITNSTGTMFVVKSDSNTDMEVYSGAGSMLGIAAINGSGSNTDIAASTKYIFHDAYPTVAAVSLGTSLDLGSQVKLFKFTVQNSGSVDLRMSTTTIAVTANGLSGNGSATGTIYDWRLYEDNGAGGLGTYLAATSSYGLAGGAGVATSTETATIGWNIGTSQDIVFGIGDDQGGMFDNLTVPANSSRTFILTANTSAAWNGRTTGTLTVNGKISGSTGWNGTSAWNTGNLTYFYTPAGGSEISSAVSHSDSYDVLGTSLRYTQ